MEIQILDHVVYAEYADLRINDAVVDQIANHTVETWQPDRKDAEKGRNTRQGKIAEEIVESFLNNYFAQRLSMKTYDEIRNDNFEKHAPFDFLLWRSGSVDISPIENSIRNDISAAQDKNVQLSANTRQLCRDLNVKIVEVKSTNIRDSLNNEAAFNGDYNDRDAVVRLANTIKAKDDVFCYPSLKRSEARRNYSIEDYCREMQLKEPALRPYEGEELKNKVLDIEAAKQHCDLFIRIYLDQQAKKGFVIGWIKRERLLDHSAELKRMRQPNKSEKALYFAKSLEETEPMDQLLTAFE